MQFGSYKPKGSTSNVMTQLFGVLCLDPVMAVSSLVLSLLVIRPLLINMDDYSRADNKKLMNTKYDQDSPIQCLVCGGCIISSCYPLIVWSKCLCASVFSFPFYLISLKCFPGNCVFISYMHLCGITGQYLVQSEPCVFISFLQLSCITGQPLVNHVCSLAFCNCVASLCNPQCRVSHVYSLAFWFLASPGSPQCRVMNIYSLAS